MLITTKSFEKPFELAKKILKFIWRHCFTIYVLSLIVRVLLAGHICILTTCVFLGGAIILDWAKQFIKLTPNPNRRHLQNDPFSSFINRRHNDYRGLDPCVPGTPAFFAIRRDQYR